jgi:uncharacterized DUF497 family protein
MAGRWPGHQIVHTICVRISFDPTKNERNVRERGLSFGAAADFDFDSALVWVDDRQPYGETRYVAIGWLYGRLHVLCFTEAPGGIRVISLRKANPREVRRHAQNPTTD